MDYQLASGFHIGTAISALVLGLCVFFTRKGTRLHKQLGYAYFFNMLSLNISALFIYRLTGEFGPFHASALASLLTLIAGFIPAFLRLPHGRWLELHYELMNWSYVGLVAAGASEATTRLPAAPFWPAVVVGSAIVFIVGGMLIARGRSRYRFEAMARQSGPPMDLGEALKRKRAACS
ncbi:MAG TPA: DUF2306 domain-containing protein [Anaerolineales bacterium]|nr:DUF2306 domain-containing protein [Anaerolineales bacterium]